MSLRYLSVCSGIEAASCAWHPLGFEAVAFSEIEAFPSAVLAARWPGVPNLGDMTQFQSWPSYAINLLVGGTPCQSFSVAGLRKGLADPRGNLALTFLAIAARYRPKWVVWENVPGVLSDAGNAFGCFLAGLAELGYGWAYRILDAQHAGVPQRRRRVFVVGHLGDWRRAAAVLFERHSLQGHNPPSRQAGQGATHDLAPCIGASGRGFERTGDTRGQDAVVAVDLLCAGTGQAGTGQAGTEILRDQSPTLNCNHEQPYIAHSLRGEGFDASEDGTGRGTPLVPVAYQTSGSCGAWETGDQVAAALTTGTDPNQRVIAFAENSRAELRLCGGDGSVSSQLTTGGGKPGQGQPCVFQTRIARNGRGQPSEVVPALNGSDAGETSDMRPCVSTGTAVRRLTPRECERLQGFEDYYTLITYRGKSAADGPRYRALGNSMCVNVMRWIGQRIQRVDSLPYD